MKSLGLLKGALHFVCLLGGGANIRIPFTVQGSRPSGDDAIPVLEEETASACPNRRLRAASPAYKKWNFMTSRAFLYIMGSPSHRLTAITGMASLARAAIVGSQPKVLFQNVRGEDPFVVNCGFL